MNLFMELSLKNYTTILPKELLKNAAKNMVRECDEIEKGQFQAYVDEDKNSFDVSLTINSKGEITEHDCECNGKTMFCRHKAALLLWIVKGKNRIAPQKISKKVNPFEILVEDADPEKLKTWVKEILTKNKDLELAFIHQFSAQQKIYTPSEIKQYTFDALKAVVKNRTKLEVGEVKKLVDLWTELHAALITQYTNHITDEAAFLNFNAVIEACEEIQYKVATGSNKIVKYLENIALKPVEPLQILLDEEAWNIATGFFISRLYKNSSTISIPYLILLVTLFDVSNMDRKKKLAGLLAKQYSTAKIQHLYNVEVYTQAILKMVKDSDRFEDFYQIFKPLQFRNDYNSELISLLIKNNHLKLAEKFCEEQIKGNFRQEYNLPYLRLLKQIYTIEKDNKKLSEVLKELFPLDYDFEDYLFISAQIGNEEERKKWRTKILSKARNMGSYNIHATEFAFRLMEHEKKYAKMLEYINGYTPYSIIIKYADHLALSTKMDFLKRVIERDEHFGFRSSLQEDENILFPELLAILVKHYSKETILMAIRVAEKSNRYYRLNHFVEFAAKNIG